VCADIKPALACINELLKEEIAKGTDKWDYSEWRADVQAQREKFPMQVSRPNSCWNAVLDADLFSTGNLVVDIVLHRENKGKVSSCGNLVIVVLLHREDRRGVCW
jgi:hypothetical protein